MSWVLDRDLGDMESRLPACARQWHVRIGDALAGGHRAAVFGCWTAQGEEAVLKLTPTSHEAELEAAALTVWRDGGASVRLLDADPAMGAHLPPADEPGALRVVADLLPSLHSASVEVAFPTLRELYPYLALHSLQDVEHERRTRGEPDRAAAAVDLLPAANASAARLCATSDVTVLLHGDFIDKNLLLDGERYVSADPMPRIGDPASEVGFFAHDHLPATAILRRARALAEATGNDEVRSQRWAAVWTVLLAVSAWREDQPDLEHLVTSRAFAELLAL